MKPFLGLLLIGGGAAYFFLKDHVNSGAATEDPGAGTSHTYIGIVDDAVKAAAVPLIPSTPGVTVLQRIGIQAQAAAGDAAQLARAQKFHGMPDGSFLFNVSEWNWFRGQSGAAGIIVGPTAAGDNAISASRYLQLRTEQAGAALQGIYARR